MLSAAKNSAGTCRHLTQPRNRKKNKKNYKQKLRIHCRGLDYDAEDKGVVQLPTT
jgi:hypothetical protein